MASNAPIAQDYRELVPPVDIYNGDNPAFAGVTQVAEKEYSWIGFENVLRMYPKYYFCRHFFQNSNSGFSTLINYHKI